jgi:hypothetical protein
MITNATLVSRCRERGLGCHAALVELPGRVEPSIMIVCWNGSAWVRRAILS